MTAHYRRARKRLDALADNSRATAPLHPQLVAATIDRLAADDAVFIADVGTPVHLGRALPAHERAGAG